MTRRAYADHQQKVCMFWSPKCASRTIFRWFTETFLDLVEPDQATLKRVSTEITITSLKAMPLVTNEGYFSIAVMRHPATRVLSAYINKFVHRGQTSFNRFETLASYAQSAVVDIHALHGTPFAAKDYAGISFVDLLDLVEDRIEKRRDEPDLNAHWSTQNRFTVAADAVPFDHVCAVETLEADMAPLRAAFGDSAPEPARNASAYGASAERPIQDLGEDLARVSSLALIERDFSPAQFLSADVLSRIARLYAIDFTRFGYDPADVTAPPTIRARNWADITEAIAQARARQGSSAPGSLTSFAKRLFQR